MILVTGATGFVGSALIKSLIRSDTAEVRAAVRRAGCEMPNDAQTFDVGDFTRDTQWERALDGVKAVVHTAGRVHVMRDMAAEPLVEFRRVNVEGTLHLARQAAVAGVARFVFISSIKVNGEATMPGHPFRADDKPFPRDAYGVSKMEAEQGLLEIASKSDMEVAIIRPPLVYGPGVKANFNVMMRWLQRGVPLPFGAIYNRRSLVALDNLVNFIISCVDHPRAANQAFLVSDGDDLSTTQLLRQLGQALGKSARLLPVPAAILKVGATLIGKQDIAQRLCGSLQVDISKAQRLMNWTPPITVEEGLRRAAAGFLDGR